MDSPAVHGEDNARDSPDPLIELLFTIALLPLFSIPGICVFRAYECALKSNLDPATLLKIMVDSTAPASRQSVWRANMSNIRRNPVNAEDARREIRLGSSWSESGVCLTFGELETMCEECHRLWREHGAVAQKTFRTEERLRRAEVCQDHDLARILAEKITHIAQEATRTRKALEEHQAQAHPHTSAASGPTFG